MTGGPGLPAADLPQSLAPPARITQVREADSDGDIAACFEVLRQLRPHLESSAALIAQVLGAAGYRLTENLVSGRFVYVDDLVVDQAARRGRVGERLLDAVAETARAQGCRRLTLDTALDNAYAQRFYFRWGLLARALHFVRQID
jgi:ribosomal protein S18 acetylase RimI-like enzyme